MGDRGHDAAKKREDDVPGLPRMVFNIVPKDWLEPDVAQPTKTNTLIAMKTIVTQSGPNSWLVISERKH
jgi:hypothetical protein